MTKMFEFITSRPNPIGGCASGNYWGDEGFKLCSFDCCYCWAKDLKTRFKYPKYQGSWRLYPSEMKQYGPEDFPWPCDMIDIGDPTIPKPILEKFFKWIGEQPCRVLTLTKNPDIYVALRGHIPENAVLGATIESDMPITLKYSKAPQPWNRLSTMWALPEIGLPNDRFISIEPIMKYSPEFEREIAKIRPWAVAVGYDNYGNGLPEPSLKRTNIFIAELESITKVYRKTIRERWDA